ncbi:MAG: shikimate kinase [Verrucomicrobiota bacterium]
MKTLRVAQRNPSAILNAMKREPTNHNVILIGFMGSGKTTLGQELAPRLDFAFIDTDNLVVSQAGKPIPKIFADHGEEHFRDLESRALSSLIQESSKVIATGGGIVLRPENRALLRKIGFTVWLDASEDTIFDRVSRNTERPLLHTDNQRETIARLLTQRRPLYQESADLMVPTNDLDLGEIIHGIADSARVFFSQSGNAAT